ncbi:Fungal specific transcription factor domain-containing protein [Cladophialophora immunda]|nr:Fungal specific transcription factor domain-containing protein [Cladophialophora immunda]
MIQNAHQKRPNFLVIVADDLGFSDVGCFGGEISTPNVDRLGKLGVRFTSFYAAAACSPTRAMILTGTDHHIAGLGNLLEWTNNAPQTAEDAKYGPKPQRGVPGYEGYLNSRVVTLPEVLRDNGYHTIMSGKWHLGLTPERSPKARGFTRSFAHLPGCSNHFGWQPEYEKSHPIPTAIENSTIALHSEDGVYLSSLPNDWYSSNGYGDKMLEYLREWNEKIRPSSTQDHSQSDTPFFAYYPFTAPHWPLQAPKEYVDHYRGVYESGPEVLRQQRLKRLIELGMIKKDVAPHPVVAPAVKGWEDMTPYEQQMSSRAMEAYAGMVECLDHNIGRVVEYLESIDELDNTFILFCSDNGAEGAAMEAAAITGKSLQEHLKNHYHNDLENIGNFDSFVWYGPLWAQAATAPSRLYKGYTTEGGVRVPCVIKYPRAWSREARVNQISDTFATVMDIAPTILDLAGIQHPAPEYMGRQVVPMRGQSMVQWFESQHERIHPEDFIHGWEICGRGAIRQGKWKADFIPKPLGPEKWQLYDMEADPGETRDLAEEYPEKLADLLKFWETYVEEVGVVPLQPELGAYIEAVEAQMQDGVWMENRYRPQSPLHRLSDLKALDLVQVARLAALARLQPETGQAASGPPVIEQHGKERAADIAASPEPQEAQSSSDRPLSNNDRGPVTEQHTNSSVSPSDTRVNLSENRSNIEWLYKSQLPLRSKIRLLVKEFMENVYPLRCYAFIHKPSFMEKLDDDSTESQQGNALLLVVCALGAKFYALSHRPTTAELDSHKHNLEAGNEWAKRALYLLFSNLNAVSVDNLMVAVLLHDHEIRLGRYASAFTLTGVSTRMAQALQLNLEYSTNILEDEAHGGPSICSKEARRRLMWACYVQDALIGSGTDQLTMFRDCDIKIQLPTHERNFIYQIPCVTELCEHGHFLKFLSEEMIPQQSAENMGIMAYYVRLIEIRKRVLRYVKHLDTAQEPWVPTSEFATLDLAIHDWYTRLPSSLQLNRPAVYLRKESQQLGAFVLLQCTYHWTICDLYRISTPKLYRLPIKWHYPADFLEQLQTTMFQRARSCAIILADALAHGVETLADTWLPSVAFDSNRVMLHYVARILGLGTERGQAVMKETMPHIQSNLKCLDCMRSITPWPMRSINRQRRCGMNLGLGHSHSPGMCCQEMRKTRTTRTVLPERVEKGHQAPTPPTTSYNLPVSSAWLKVLFQKSTFLLFDPRHTPPQHQSALVTPPEASCLTRRLDMVVNNSIGTLLTGQRHSDVQSSTNYSLQPAEPAIATNIDLLLDEQLFFAPWFDPGLWQPAETVREAYDQSIYGLPTWMPGVEVPASMSGPAIVALPNTEVVSEEVGGEVASGSSITRMFGGEGQMRRLFE